MRYSKTMVRRFLPFLLIFTISLILFFPVLGTYFSQDDFFHFRISQTDGTLNGFLYLFGYHPFNERGIAFYRPLSRELIFNLYYTIFGLNAYPFRIFEFILYGINIFLIYKLVQRVFKKRIASFLAAYFFAISSANLATLYYLAGGIHSLIVTPFLILTIFFYIDFLTRKDPLKYFVLSFLTFLLALASDELAAAIPILLGITTLIYKPKNYTNLQKLWPFFLITFIHLSLDIFVIGLSPGEKQYQAVFNPKSIANTFTWYTVWALGLPETLVDFVMPGLKLNPTLMRYWGSYYLIIFPSFFASVFLLLSCLFYLLKNKLNLFDKKFLLFALWFPLCLLPVIFFPYHKSTHYLAPALVGFWTTIVFLIFNFFESLRKKRRWLSMIICITLVAAISLLSITSIYLGHTNYWAATRGKAAWNLLSQVTTKYPSIDKGSAIYFTDDPNYPFVANEWGSSSKQAAFILNNQDALRLYYKDPSLGVFYQDLGGVPANFPKDKVFTLMARF